MPSNDHIANSCRKHSVFSLGSLRKHWLACVILSSHTCMCYIASLVGGHMFHAPSSCRTAAPVPGRICVRLGAHSVDPRIHRSSRCLGAAMKRLKQKAGGDMHAYLSSVERDDRRAAAGEEAYAPSPKRVDRHLSLRLTAPVPATQRSQCCGRKVTNGKCVER